MAVAAYNNVIKTPGISTVFSTSEAFSNTTGNTYQIDDATKRVWDRTVVPTIYAGTSAVTPSSVDYLFGKVTLSAATTEAVTASGNYLPMTEKTGFNSYTLSLGGETQDRTTFENNDGYRRRQLTLHDISLSLQGFQNPWFFNYTDVGKNTATALDTAASTFRMEASHGITVGKHVRVDDEVMYVTAVSTNDLTVTRGSWGTNIAAHTSDADVFTMDVEPMSTSPIMVEIRPGGSTTFLGRGWFVVENQELSGEIASLENQSVSLQGDSNGKATFGFGGA